jgi:hypothetical protein
MNTKTETDPPQSKGMWYWANSYKVSLVLFAMLETGVLEHLSKFRQSAYILSKETGLSLEVLEPMLNLLETIGLLDHNSEGFFLPRSNSALMPLLSLEKIFSERYIRCDALIKVMKGEVGKDPMEGPDAVELLPTYLAAMSVGARTLAAHIVHIAKLGPNPRMIDLGGADGALVLAISRLIPGLQAIVIDRPQIQNAFWDRVVADGAQTKIRFIAGDLRRPAKFEHILAQADTVLVSNILHLLSWEDREALLRCVLDYVLPGARLLVYDQFLPQDNMLDSTNLMVIDWLLCGYRFDLDVQSFISQLSNLGFVSITSHLNATFPGAIVRAEKPSRLSHMD